MGKEKLVYILNPDGLTESIFVARGEKNEGEYRGKRFTKAGLKAERKRQQEELKASIIATPAHLEEVGELGQKETSGLSFDEYYGSHNVEETVTVNKVKIHGGIIGWLGVFDSEGNMVKYYEKGTTFNSKEEIKKILKDLNVTAGKIKFLQTKQNAFIFTCEGETF